MPIVRLFGAISLEAGTSSVWGKATQRHPLALLSLLAVAQPRSVRRDRLVGLLWPEKDTRRARNLLNQAVHALRKGLGRGAVVSVGDELRLDPRKVRTDVAEFQAALVRHDPSTAVGLYEGPFLEGFFLSDSPEFDRWVDQERHRLATACADALDSLAEAAEETQDLAEAARWWKARARHDPYDSRVVLRLMKVLAAAGNRAGALQHAAQHEQLLRDELGIEPSMDLLALSDQIRSDTIAAVAQLPPPSRSAPALMAGPPGAPSVTTASGEVPVEGVPPGPERERGMDLRSLRRKRSIGAVGVLCGLLFVGWAVGNGSPGNEHPEIQRVAVLPPANLSGDPEEDYFTAGMHDALVSELARLEWLTIYPTQSVLRYRNSDLPLPLIADELGVDAVVTASVFRGGDRVRITAQLVRARPEATLWADSFEGALGNALELQREVAKAVARSVRVFPEPEGGPVERQATTPQAQEAYLKGLYHLGRANYSELPESSLRREEQRSAIALLEESVALDSAWAPAQAKLALAYHWKASSSPPDAGEFYRKAKMAALRALELDETESQAHASLGFVLYRYEWDWEGADRALRRAMELDPNSHHWIYARYLQAAGRHDEAIAHFHMAQERDPLSDLLKMQVVGAYGCAGRYDEAVSRARELESRMGGSASAALAGDAAETGLAGFMARYLSQSGRHDEAIEMLEDQVAQTDSLPAVVSSLAFAYALAGRVDEARPLADRLEEQSEGTGGTWRPAHLYAALGDTDRALAMVEAASTFRRDVLPAFRCTHTYRLLGNEPRVQALLNPVGFPN